MDCIIDVPQETMSTIANQSISISVHNFILNKYS